MKKRKKKAAKRTYSTKIVRHYVTARMGKLAWKEFTNFRWEIKALAGAVTALANRMEDIDGSLWDSRQAQEVQSGRLMELAKLIKEVKQ